MEITNTPLFSELEAPPVAPPPHHLGAGPTVLKPFYITRIFSLLCHTRSTFNLSLSHFFVLLCTVYFKEIANCFLSWSMEARGICFSDPLALQLTSTRRERKLRERLSSLVISINIIHKRGYLYFSRKESRDAIQIPTTHQKQYSLSLSNFIMNRHFYSPSAIIVSVFSSGDC